MNSPTHDNNRRSLISAEMLARLGGPNLVYVREVARGELAGEVPEEMLGASDKFYAVHTASGERVAILTDRASAFAAAVQNDMEPVSVH